MKRILLILICVIVSILLIWYLLPNPKKNIKKSVSQTATSSSSSEQEAKIYKSSSMDILIEVPNGYQIQEKFNVLTISSGDELIRISRIGTNFINLDDYIKSLEKLNGIIFSKVNNLNVNGLPAQVGMIEDEKIYFIYVDSIVYSLSSKDINMFSDLDQIAQSFQYTP